MKQILLTAMHSGAGKTVVTCALLAALKKRGLDVRSFKGGPDYIDPMFHSRVLGVPSRNLDLFLQGTGGIARTLRRSRGDVAVIEGAMGYYDGLAGTTEASAWETATALQAPAVLILRPKGAGVSLAAQVKGMLEFRENSRIRALLLADCKPMLASYLTKILTRETGLPVLGYMPPMEEAVLESRHLGLLTAGEIRDLSDRIGVLAEQMEKSVRIDELLMIAEETLPDAGKTEAAGEDPYPGNKTCTLAGQQTESVRIAVARDKAFCFYYEDSLDALREAGAETVFFSPLEEAHLPENVDGLYIGGGYPELYAMQLSSNAVMRREIAAAIRNGLPAIAECGGFLYLQKDLEDTEGRIWPMCGVLSGKGFRTDRLQRFGYQYLTAAEESMLFRKGEHIPVHEFHYWDCTDNGSDLKSEKPDGRSWTCGFAGGSLYAAFPHLHLDGEYPLAERFVRCCRAKKEICRDSAEADGRRSRV